MRDGRSLRYFEVFTLYNLTRHFYKHFAFAARAPSVAYGASSLPEGAFHKTHPASIPCLLILTGNSLF